MDQRQLLNAYQSRMAADVAQVYLAGGDLDGVQSAVLGVGSQVQAVISSVYGALGPGQGAAQARRELEQAASALEKGFGAIGANVSTMAGGLRITSGLLLQNEQANLAPFGRTVTDPRPGLQKLLAMERMSQ